MTGRRVLIVACAVAIVAAWGYFAFQLVDNPRRAQMVALNERLASVGTEEVKFVTKPELNYSQLVSTIESKPSLWQELIPPPPPPPPPPPKPPAPPDLNQMLAGVRIQKGQLGSGENTKLLISTPHDGSGSLYKVGDTLNGLTIESITDSKVVFSLTKDGKEYTTSLPRP